MGSYGRDRHMKVHGLGGLSNLVAVQLDGIPHHSTWIDEIGSLRCCDYFWDNHGWMMAARASIPI